MVQFSNEILNEIGAHKLSELEVCGAKELPELPDFLSIAIWRKISNALHPSPVVRRLDINLLRKTIAAFEAYNSGRMSLRQYVDANANQRHNLQAALSALNHFENCLGALWEACELFNKMEHEVTGLEFKRHTLFVRDTGTDLERISKLNNFIKHFSIEQACRSATPIWLTNEGLECADASLSFDELHHNLVALSEVVRVTFVEIPQEAFKRQQMAQDCSANS